MLYNAAGNPEPSPEIQRRLRALDSRLYLEFMPDFARHWALKCRWQDGDRRWERVQTGAIPESSAADIVGWLPMDCSVDEAPAYLERSLSVFSERQADRVLFDVERWNRSGARDEQVQEVLADLAGGSYGANDHRVAGRRTRIV